jgi:AcrR family transcriptional regulator
VSKALLYHYYPGRDALVFAIIQTHLSELDAAVAGADDPALAPEARLRALVHAVIEAYRDADDAHKVQLNLTPTLPGDDRAAIVAIERRIVRRFAAVLRLVAPDLDPARLMPVTMSLFGMMNWVYMWFRDGGPLDRAAYADLATDLILGGLPTLTAAGAASSPGPGR